MDAKFSFLCIFLPFLLIGCGGGGGNSNSNSGISSDSSFCANLDSRQRLLTLMEDQYLWYDKLPQPDLNDSRYCSLATLLDDLRYKAEDRFSYIRPKTVSDSFFNDGQYSGFGFGYSFDATKSAAPIVAFVYSDSPAGRANVKRGDRILSLNGLNTANLSVSDFRSLLSRANDTGSAAMRLQGPNQPARSVTVAKATVTINSVLDSRVINHNGTNVGYVAFNTFIRPSEQELDSAFAALNATGISELVVDLRYNSGGFIYISAQLASLAAGQVAENSVFTQYRHNTKQTALNTSILFTDRPAAVSNLNRIIVLTQSGTCSASELFINGLRPWLGAGSVITIGGATCGKPFGSYFYTLSATSIDGKAQEFNVSPIAFRTVNSLGQGDYISGISANCAASDDLDKQFGEPSEGMLQSALSYIESGACSPSIPRRHTNDSPLPHYDVNTGV